MKKENDLNYRYGLELGRMIFCSMTGQKEQEELYLERAKKIAHELSKMEK